MSANVKSMEEYFTMHRESLKNPEKFWRPYVCKFYWNVMPTLENTLSYNFDVRKGEVSVKWFTGGQTNICYNALDVHLQKGSENKVAFYWEGNGADDRTTLTYTELHQKVIQFGASLLQLGIRRGDTVAIYMPMIPELIIAMLACSRIGAVHSVVFGGYSATALANRILDAKCKLLITCDGAYRGTKLINLYDIASQALDVCEQGQEQQPSHIVPHCIVLKHVTLPPYPATEQTKGNSNDQPSHPGDRPALNVALSLKQGRDIWWDDLLASVPPDPQCPVAWMDAEDPLFILYTSGSTGHPKGVLHTVGGYMVYTATTFFYTFDYHEDDVYWCTADAGWITGHSYVVYGPLLNGATSVIFEGIPTFPDEGRSWALIDRYQVTKFYTSPTALRTLLRAGDQFVKAYNRSSLKILGSVGEPLNSQAWKWYYSVVGEERCAIVDTFWQTETGGHMLTGLPGCMPMKPGCASRPFFGVDPRILSETGEELTPPPGEGTPTSEVSGYLVFTKPWPGMMRTLYGNHQRFEDTYFTRFPGYYIAGDGAKMDTDGDIWITGRIDDMLNVSGHLISTAEVESALLHHPLVAESAVVAQAHPVKGECLHCFVTLKDGLHGRHDHTGLTPQLQQQLRELVRKYIGPFATPEYIQEAPALPKTRSGKIIRRLLREIVNGVEVMSDTSTLANPECLTTLIQMKSNG